MSCLETPVLFLIFNRPALTGRVFEEIKKQKPKKLYIAGDGPRHEKKGEAEICSQTRKIVIDNIDWDCEMFTLFRDENLGCGKAVSSAIDWFFGNVEEGIILEDDCLPDATFFSFSEDMLSYYRDKTAVMHIGATNYQQGIARGDGSYYLSRFAHIWGWASWRRAWEKYDFSLEVYKDFSKTGLNHTLRRHFDRVYKKQVDTWDIQWFMSVWFNHGLCITPNKNLIENIGYSSEATHTNRRPKWQKKMSVDPISEIIHPSSFEIDDHADEFTLNEVFKTALFKRLSLSLKDRFL